MDSIHVESMDYLHGFHENYKNHGNMWIVRGQSMDWNLGVFTAKKNSMESWNIHGVRKSTWTPQGLSGGVISPLAIHGGAASVLKPSPSVPSCSNMTRSALKVLMICFPMVQFISYGTFGTYFTIMSFICSAKLQNKDKKN